MKMNKRIKKLFLKDLRSDEYDQVQGTLVETSCEGNDSFCCLGLLCNIYAEQEGKYWDDAETGAFEDCLDTSDTTLPYFVQEWSGIETDDGQFKYRNGVKSNLVHLNDEKGKTFKEIADVIERYF